MTNTVREAARHTDRQKRWQPPIGIVLLLDGIRFLRILWTESQTSDGDSPEE